MLKQHTLGVERLRRAVQGQEQVVITKMKINKWIKRKRCKKKSVINQDNYEEKMWSGRRLWGKMGNEDRKQVCIFNVNFSQHSFCVGGLTQYRQVKATHFAIANGFWNYFLANEFHLLHSLQRLLQLTFAYFAINTSGVKVLVPCLKILFGGSNLVILLLVNKVFMSHDQISYTLKRNMKKQKWEKKEMGKEKKN